MLVGVSEVPITPESGYPLGGYAERYFMNNRAIGKLNDIYARAMILSGDKEESLIISIEILAFENDFADEIKNKLSKLIGIEKNNIYLVATHTHSAPDVMLNMILFKELLKTDEIELIKRYREFLLSKLIEAAKLAKDNLYETELYFCKTKAEGFCANRVNPEWVRDNEISILTDKKKWAFINLTCHPTVLGASNLKYSGDFLSYTTMKIKEQLGEKFITLYGIGAAGDQSTRFIRRNQSPEEARRIGYIVADSVINGLKKSEKIGYGNISTSSITVELPRKNIDNLRNELTIKVREWQKQISAGINSKYLRKLQQDLATAKIILNNFSKFENYLRNYPDRIPINISILKINDLKFVFLPLELACEYSIEIKSKHKNVWIITYANGYYGYLPTEKAYEELDYESMMSPFSKQSGRILVSKIESSL